LHDIIYATPARVNQNQSLTIVGRGTLLG